MVRKFSAFHGIKNFITVLTRTQNWNIKINFTPLHQLFSNPTLILCSHLRLDLQSCLLPSVLYTTFSFPTHATWPIHLTLDLIPTLTGKHKHTNYERNICKCVRDLFQNFTQPTCSTGSLLIAAK